MNEHERITEAYMEMAKVGYRPGAPSDGMGSILLSEAKLDDKRLLISEAMRYSGRFLAEEDTRRFMIGVSHWPTNRAFVYVVEAARLLCVGKSGTSYAQKLLRLALQEIEKSEREKQEKSEVLVG